VGKRFNAVVVMLAALATPVWASQSPADAAREFGAPAFQSDLTLSRSGQMLAWRQRSGSGFAVIVYDLAAAAVRRTVQLDPSLTLGWLLWEDDDTLLLGITDTEHLPSTWNGDLRGQPIMLSRVLALDVASGRTRVLLADRMLTSGFNAVHLDTGVQLLAWDIGRPHTVIMSAPEWLGTDYRSGIGTRIHDARSDSGWVGALFSVNTLTGKDQPLVQGDAFTVQWMVDTHGNPVARAERRPQERSFAILASQGREWRQIYRRSDGVEPQLWGLDADRHAILATMRGTDGRAHLWAIPLDGSAPTLMLHAVPQQVTSVSFARYADRPTAVWLGVRHPRRIWIDAAARLRYQSVAHAFPGREVSVLDHSQDGKKILAEVEDSSHPPVCYLVDFATHKAIIAGEAYPQLDHASLANPSEIQYRTGDGRTVHAQVLLPPGGGKQLPLVVLPPGGLVGTDPNKFDWLAQYLTARGYAVLRPLIPLDYLASEGGWVTWGGASQTYALDGVRQLVAEDLADPRRVCIVGVAYGGYAALAGVAFSPETYACAVSVNGMSDLPALLGDAHKLYGRQSSKGLAWTAWRTEVGSRFDPKVAAASPVQAAQAVVAPVLLIHDVDDTVVPVEQSAEMQRALQRAGKRVTFIKLDGGDHWLAGSAARVQVLKAMGGFLDKYLH
jgi:dipeptidyl aminopeptidase/acylaminoacyl peptidase